MDLTAVRGEAGLTAAEEARLARAAAAGDGSAFAALYERYERRAFNFAYRIAGSEAVAADAVQEAFLDAMRSLPQLGDRELDFGRYLLAATRDACHDLMRKRPGPRPGETIPESWQDEVREASMQLPERQREVLALNDLGELSYEEIAAIMEVNGNTVAQLISRARINFCDEMRGTALASVATPSPECERALPLIAARDDGQLEAGSRDAVWLDAHLADCHRCRLGVEAMQDADSAYRAWAPMAAAPWLLKETMARAAEAAGADWSEATTDASAARGPTKSPPGAPSAYRTDRGRRKPPHRRVTLAAGLAALLLLVGVAVAVVGDDPAATPADTATGVGQGWSARVPKGGKAGAKKTGAQKTAAAETIPAAAATLVQAPNGGEAPSGGASHPTRPPEETAVQPPQQTSKPKPGSKPKPAAVPTPAPQTAPTPAASGAEEPPPAEPAEKPHGHEPHGKATGQPPR
jgi:RNA polymerase sigma factor (sigma-70 family)